MALGCPQIDQPTLGDDQQPPVATLAGGDQELLDEGRTWRRRSPPASLGRAARSISRSKWPKLARITPAFMIRKCSAASTSRLPVTVVKASPSVAACAIGSTRNAGAGPERGRAQAIRAWAGRGDYGRATTAGRRLAYGAPRTAATVAWTKR